MGTCGQGKRGFLLFCLRSRGLESEVWVRATYQEVTGVFHRAQDFSAMALPTKTDLSLAFFQV